ncbi:MAG: ribbon-helix-helix protein, CopG family [Mesorhizobium sp.]|nr:MAG: ribbon-helix-helix protein, CopG family [Mesorhizobium sp.]
MAMHKQMISLTQPQIDFLRQEAARLDISVSDLIRRIIDQHRENRS